MEKENKTLKSGDFHSLWWSNESGTFREIWTEKEEREFHKKCNLELIKNLKNKKKG